MPASLFPCLSRCRGAFVLSLGLSVLDGDSRVSGGDPVSASPLGDGAAPFLLRSPLLPVADGLAVAWPCGDAVARGLAAAVPSGVSDPLPAGEVVASGDPVAAGDALAAGERVAAGEAPALVTAPAAPATPVVVVVAPETPTPALTP